jgi:hypothetical protein
MHAGRGAHPEAGGGEAAAGLRRRCRAAVPARRRGAKRRHPLTLSIGEISMENEFDKMDRFEFLTGEWNLKYNIPKSVFGEAAKGTGQGRFKKALDDKYVYFDYESNINDQEAQAHGIFAWDDKYKIYRFWWFESSGNFSQATCDFISDDVLFLNWHDSLLIQTFSRINPSHVILRMERPAANGKNELILEVIFKRR